MCSHPTVWKFFRGIQKDIADNRLILQQANVANPDKQRSKYKIIATRLSDKIAEYDQADNKVKYLREVANIAYGRGHSGK